MNWREGVTASLSRIEQKQDGLTTELAEFKKAVFGNGQPGHAQRISALEANENLWYGKASIISWLIAALLWIAIALIGEVSATPKLRRSLRFSPRFRVKLSRRFVTKMEANCRLLEPTMEPTRRLMASACCGPSQVMRAASVITAPRAMNPPTTSAVTTTTAVLR